MNRILIEDWELLYTQPNPYTPPECCPTRLSGKVYGHPAFPDGTEVTTSRIVDTCGHFVKTKHSVYLLGRASDRYDEWAKTHSKSYETGRPPFPAKEVDWK